MSKRDRNKARRRQRNGRTAGGDNHYELTSRTTFTTTHTLSPQQFIELQMAANRGQNEAIQRWIEHNLNGGAPCTGAEERLTLTLTPVREKALQ